MSNKHMIKMKSLCNDPKIKRRLLWSGRMYEFIQHDTYDFIHGLPRELIIYDDHIFLGKTEAVTIYNNSLKLFVCGENILYPGRSKFKQLS